MSKRSYARNHKTCSCDPSPELINVISNRVNHNSLK